MGGKTSAQARDEEFDPDRTLPMERQDEADQQVKRGGRNDQPEPLPFRSESQKQERAFLKKSAAKNFCSVEVARAIRGLRASR
jgi:hypothetical protein